MGVRDLVSPDLPLHPRWTPLVGLRGLPSCPSPSPAGAPRSSSDRGACRSSRTGRPPPHLSFTCFARTEQERLAALLLSFRPSVCAPLPTSPTPSADPDPSLDPSEPRLPASARVPPSWFPTTSTVSSGARFPACCSRYRTWGSPGCTRVDRRQPRLVRIASRIPSDAHTLRRLLPRRQPYRITAAAPLLPFRESRDRSCATLRLAEARSTRWHSAPDLPPSRLPIRSRRSPVRLSRELRRAPRAGRLQGLAPPTSPWHPVPLPASDARSFHGFPSPSRPASRRGNPGSRPDPIPRSVRLAWIRRSRPAHRFASVRRSVRSLAAAGLPGVLYVKERLDLGVGLARKFD